MASNPNERAADAKMDPNALYREEIITDRKVGLTNQLQCRLHSRIC